MKERLTGSSGSALAAGPLLLLGPNRLLHGRAAQRALQLRPFHRFLVVDQSHHPTRAQRPRQRFTLFFFFRTAQGPALVTAAASLLLSETERKCVGERQTGRGAVAVSGALACW